MALPAPRTVRQAVTVWYPSGTGATALASFLAAFIALPLSLSLPGCRLSLSVSSWMSGIPARMLRDEGAVRDRTLTDPVEKLPEHLRSGRSGSHRTHGRDGYGFAAA